MGKNLILCNADIQSLLREREQLLERLAELTSLRAALGEILAIETLEFDSDGSAYISIDEIRAILAKHGVGGE